MVARLVTIDDSGMEYRAQVFATGGVKVTAASGFPELCP
jgi:hypothetical protein